MSAEWGAADKANKQHCHKTATREKFLANNAKAHCCQELVAYAVALAESVLAKE
jgi:hypothetical protein